MSRNAICDFWFRQSNSEEPLSPQHLAALKGSFGVVGEIRPVAGAHGYAVSDDGRVFSSRPCARTGECPRELRQTKTQYGYRMVRLQVLRRQTSDGVHRLVAKAFLPPPESHQTVVRHLDGNPSNNRADNLAWGTQADNLADAVRHGRTLKGLKNPNAKLNDRLVVAARILCGEGYSHSAVAHFLGVDSESVRRACTKEQWAHVGERQDA